MCRRAAAGRRRVASVVVTAAGATPPAVAGTAPPGVRAVARRRPRRQPGAPRVPRARRRHRRCARSSSCGTRRRRSSIARAPRARRSTFEQRYSMLVAGEEGARHVHVLREHRLDDRHAVAAELRARHDSLSSSSQRAPRAPARPARRRGGSRRTPARAAARIRAPRSAVVGRLAPAEVAERRRVVEIVDADGARLGEPLLDPVPRRMLEVEREPERRVERAEQQLDQRRRRARSSARRAPGRAGRRARASRSPKTSRLRSAVAGQLRRELEAVRHLLRPAVELLLGRQPVAGRVQLDRREALRVEARESAAGSVPAG